MKISRSFRPKYIIVSFVGLVLLLGAGITWHNGNEQNQADLATAAKQEKTTATVSAGRPATKQTQQPVQSIATPTPVTVKSPDAGSTPPVMVQPTLGAGGIGLATAGVLYSPNDTVSVGIYENSGNRAVNSVQVYMTYDADRLQYEGIDGAVPFNIAAAADTATPGILRIARATQTGVTGTQPVATIRFTVKTGASTAVQGQAAISVHAEKSLLIQETTTRNILSSGTGLELTIK